MARGRLFVVSGPSGVGKGTLLAKVREELPGSWDSISATTRLPREGEADGVSYFFMNRDDFEAKVAQDGFLEWAEYSGNVYGTPRGPIEDKLDAGTDVILEIEVQGALQVKEKMPEAKLIFIEPPSFEELERRLRERATESEEAVQRRLETAKVELASKMEYDIQLVNDDLDKAACALLDYMKSA